MKPPAMELEAAPLPPMPAECGRFVALMGELEAVQRIEAEAAASLPGLRAEAARLGEEAEAAEGAALLARIPHHQVDKLAHKAQAARAAVQAAERRGAAARRERLRLEAAIIAEWEGAGEALRRWGAEAAQPRVQAYATALGALYEALGALQAIRLATNANVLADPRHFRLPRAPTATDLPFAEIEPARLPDLDPAGEVRMALEAADRLSWKHDRAA